MISGLNPATAGAVLFEGRDITRLAPEAICHAGIARTFQLNASFERLSVRDNVRVAAYFGRSNRLMPGLPAGPRGRRSGRCGAGMPWAGAAIGRSLAGQLPVLDRKLLMLAGALATQPKLLLMDEPVGGLNPQEIDAMMEAVRRIASTGIAIILIEHVMRFLVALSPRVLIMHHGEKIYEGPPQGLVKDRQVIDVYLGEGASQRLGAFMGAGA